MTNTSRLTFYHTRVNFFWFCTPDCDIFLLKTRWVSYRLASRRVPKEYFIHEPGHVGPPGFLEGRRGHDGVFPHRERNPCLGGNPGGRSRKGSAGENRGGGAQPMGQGNTRHA